MPLPHLSRLLRAAGVYLALGLVSPSLRAQIVSYTFSGVTTTNFVEAGAITTEFPLGTPWTAVVAWDTGSSPLYLDASQGQYRITTFTLTFQGVSGDWTTSALPNQASFTQNYLMSGTQDQTQFTSGWGPASLTNQNIADWQPYSINIILTDLTGTAIPSLSPTPTGLDFSDWSPLVANSQLKLYLNNNANRYILGHIQSINVTGSAVPEPSTYAALAGLAVLGFVVITRRRRTQPRA